jgi:protein-S-isoprenylcysteine O-methyltransferase Ste14
LPAADPAAVFCFPHLARNAIRAPYGAPQEDTMSATAIRPFNQKIRIAVLRGFFLLAVPLILFTRSAWMEPGWLFDLFEVTGVFLIITSVLGRFWAILYIGALKNHEVMQDGPYSICRHPLYLFSTIGVIGFGMMLGSLLLTLFLGGAAFAILTATAHREEAFLRAEFGAAYDRYAARVPRIWPRLALFEARPTVTSSIAALRTNFFDALVFLAFIPLAELMEGLKEAGLLPTVPLF